MRVKGLRRGLSPFTFLAVAIGLTLFLAWFLFIVETASADGHVKTFFFGPDQGNVVAPCTITLAGMTDDAQTRADVQAAYDAFANAMANSKWMRAKVFDVCQKFGGPTIHIGRNIKDRYGDDVVAGTGELGGDEAWIDPGDFDDVENALGGKDQDKTKLMDNIWTWLLAHEIDHLRHTDTENHNDPDPDPAKSPDRSGPAVKDENHVHGDLGTDIERNNYFGPVIFTVDGQAVTWDVGKTIEDSSKVFGPASPDVFSVSTGDLMSVPPTWQPLQIMDADLDGVTDEVDSAPNKFNPNQVDVDHDGVPQVLDDDDDGDLIPDVLEEGAGADSMDPNSTKEHWSVPSTCRNGIDDDLDEITDDADASCIAPPFVNNFPGFATSYPYLFPNYNNSVLGGVQEGYDLLPVEISMSVDADLSGSGEQEVRFRGPVLIQRGISVDAIGGDGIPDTVPIEIIGLSLQSVEPISVTPLGERTTWRIRDLPGSRASGELRDLTPGAPNFPVHSFFDVFTELSVDGGATWAASGDALSGELKQWPPLGDEMTADAPLEFRDETGDVQLRAFTPKLRFTSGDLVISKTAIPQRVTVGDYQTYRLAVTNMGPVTQDFVRVVDTLPGNPNQVPLVVSTTTTRGSCLKTTQSGKQVISCGLGSMGPNATALINIKTVPRNAGVFTNSATIDASFAETDYRNNKSSVQVTVDARAGCDLVGTPLNDTMTGNSGNNRLCGLGGNDILRGGGGNDILRGGEGNDTLDGGAGDDLAYGEGGNDIILGQSGNDRMDGGSGTDTANFAGAPGAVTATLTGSKASGWGADTLAGIENIVGSPYADYLAGNALANYLSGGKGNDTLYPGAGNDSVAGGEGADTVSFFNAPSRVSIDLTLNKATGQGTDTLNSIEKAIGTNYNDYLKGNWMANTLSGLGGADAIHGMGGNDSLWGGAGGDWLYGGYGNDFLSGGLANDYLNGGPNADTCRQDSGSGKRVGCER